MFRDHREGKDEEDEQELQVRRRWWKQRKDGQKQKKRQLLVKPERTDEQRETVERFSEVRQVRSQNRLWLGFFQCAGERQTFFDRRTLTCETKSI